MRPLFRALLPVSLLALPLLARVPPASAGEQPPSKAPAAAPVGEPGGTPRQASEHPREKAPGAPVDAEGAPLPAGFSEVFNPAFPQAPVPDAVPLERGRRFEAADLAPYFATGALAQAKADYDAGRYAQAFEALKGQGDSPPVRYLRAIAALDAGDPGFAAPELARLARDYPAIADRCLVHAGVADEDLSRFAEAAALYEQVPAGSRLYVDARFGLSRVRRQLGDVAGARKALEPLTALAAPSWGRDVAAEALLASADLARQAGEPKAEQEALTTLWASHPLSPLARAAERRLKGRRAPDAIVTRGEQLIEAHRNAQGLAVLEPLLPSLALPSPLACRAHFAFGKGLRKERLHTRAIQVLTPVVEKCKADPELRARALYVLGSSRSIVDPAHGAETYEALIHDYPAHPFADDALFYAADLYLRSGDAKAAVDRLQALVDRYPNGDFASEALFKLFWIQRSQKQLDDARRTLARIERQYANAEESYDVERASYWRARMLEDEGKKGEAAQLFAALATQHPATYYGLMARTRLPDLDPERAEAVARSLVFPRTSEGPWPLYAGTLGDDPHFRAGVELLRMGFGDAASVELQSADRARQPAEALRLLVHALAAAGDERGAHAIARVALRRDLGGRITPDKRPLWEVAYPNAFRALIEKHCAEAKIDPDLLQALMREESALDPKALSWAGALGLTQLMPSTAKMVARAYRIQAKVTPERLLDPDLNIRLGALNLGSLIREFKGVNHFAVASYNAGDGAVNRWRSDRPRASLDEWVEEIPIAETRGYVKRVLRSYNTYQLLYGHLAQAARPAGTPGPGTGGAAPAPETAAP